MELITVTEAQKITGKALVIQELNEAIKLTAEAGKTFFVIVEASKIYRYINHNHKLQESDHKQYSHWRTYRLHECLFPWQNQLCRGLQHKSSANLTL